MNMAAGALGVAHVGRVTLTVTDLRLVDDVMNVMAGKPDGETREEQRHHIAVAGDGAATTADDNDDDNDDNEPGPAVRRDHLHSSGLTCHTGAANNPDAGGPGDNSANIASNDDDFYTPLLVTALVESSLVPVLADLLLSLLAVGELGKARLQSLGLCLVEPGGLVLPLLRFLGARVVM
ncbi:hypothetical protein L873DRAFT_593743 [Choiromyces venosus 120613-1]|uniref:Uncharacterized protein n=1 Tax=Choiromyces venosus 120613-1 TaxID=1336337 RepID=A0A3N4IU73_9PEZI|nr:hypothetical protein L873DRAFT_593743 [Choiromyces venosus 120613-1]